MASNENASIWRFEDVFHCSKRYQHLKSLLDYVTTFPDGTKFEYESLQGKMKEKVNKSQPDEFPHWRNWSLQRVAQFQEICGELMHELGYGQEPEWQDKCEAARNAGLLNE